MLFGSPFQGQFRRQIKGFSLTLTYKGTFVVLQALRNHPGKINPTANNMPLTK